MAGSGFGTNFRITTWGETHGAGVGVVVDGCPAGLSLDREDVQKYLNRRKPGQSKYTTQRKEGDQVEILSGVFEGKTTGTPISMVVYNKDQRSKDYSNIKDVYRPGHADFTFDMKYGFRDYRGGGRSSGRETIGRVAAGAVAAKVLEELEISVKAYAKAIAGIEISEDRFDLNEMNNNPFNMPDKEAADLVAKKADQMINARSQGCQLVLEKLYLISWMQNFRRQLCLLELLKGLRSEMDLQLQTLEDQRIMIILSVWMAKQ